MLRLGLAAAGALALLSVGCSSTLVSKEQYERDVAAQKEYISSLERRNADLEAKARALENLEQMNLVARTQDELYDQIAAQLKTALDTLRGEDGDVTFDPASGKWTMGADLLFDSGSWSVSSRGQEVLKKFADAHKERAIRFRIVGHTDRAPIARPKTQQALETDTNMELSARRAISVMGALKKCGLSEGQFAECVGMGNIRPAAPNDRVAANMKKNRRVEIYVLRT
jgi:flagellar motor protein MotB